MKTTLIIDDEFKALLPPLTSYEFEQLEKSILSEGIQEPIKTWNSIIIDGHNRYTIALKHLLPFQTVEKQFNSREEAKIWMIDFQNGRRNLTDGWKYKLAQSKKGILSAQGKSNQGERTDLLSTVDKKLKPHNTQKELALELGWSTGKLATADYVWKKADEATKQEIKAGNKSFNQVYKELKAAENRQYPDQIPITVDPEFSKILPPLTEAEFNGLEQSCKSEGIYNALVVWNGILLDGHARYEIAKKHGLPYKVHSLQLDSREDAILWIISNQTGQKNLNQNEKVLMAIKHYKELEKRKIFSEVKEKLLEIKENLLYKKEYATFEEYCKQKWQLSDEQIQLL